MIYLLKICLQDPLREKQRKCTRVISVMHVYKEDNGKEMSCTFQYKNTTDYLIMYPKVKVLCKYKNCRSYIYYVIIKFVILVNIFYILTPCFYSVLSPEDIIKQSNVYQRIKLIKIIIR
jgi:hypothetical protein